MTDPRLRTALRAQEGRRLLPRLQAELSTAFGRDVQPLALVDLSETDRLWKELEARAASVQQSHGCIAFTVPFSEAPLAPDVLALLAHMGTLPPIDLLLFHPLSQYCGAVVVASDELLRAAPALVEVDGPTLAAMSQDGACGLLVEALRDAPDGGTTNILIWGPDWQDAATNELGAMDAHRVGERLTFSTNQTVRW